jgi:nitroreductase
VRIMLNELVTKRYSPRAFSAASITETQLKELLEAARLAPSSSNVQPWRFVYALKQHEASFAQIADALVDSNRIWAPKAAALIVAIAQEVLPNGKTNHYAAYDTGTATAWLTVQATSMGLFVHQMGGFDREKARTTLQIEEGYKPLAILAIGYLGDPKQLPEANQESEIVRTTRLPMEEIAYQGTFTVQQKEKRV